MNVPFERRGARFDDYMVALKKVWAGDVVEHQSDFINWSGFQSYPIPVQRPGVPLIIGGSKGKIYERIARHGDGWFAPTVDAQSLTPMLDKLRATCAELGRDYNSIEITSMWNNQGGMEAIEAFEKAGVSRLLVPLFAMREGPVEGMAALAENVIAKLS